MTRGAAAAVAKLKARGYTQEKLAELTCRNQGTVSRWLAGELMPGIHDASVLQKCLGIPISWWSQPSADSDAAPHKRKGAKRSVQNARKAGAG